MCSTFYIHIWRHPVKDQAPQADIGEYICRRERLSTLKKRCVPEGHWVIRLDGQIISKCDWKTTRVRPGCKVEFLPDVEFFAFIWAAIVYVWPIAVQVAIAFAFSYLGGMLFNQDYDETQGGDDPSENYSWNPRTRKREGLARPRPYGNLMMHGNVVSEWTSVNDDDNEILNLIIDYGEGPVAGAGANIQYLNDQPAGNFADVVTQERLGTMNQTVMEGFEKEKIEYSLNWELTKDGGAQTFTTPNNFFDDLEFTISFPYGLIKYHHDGSETHATVHIKIEMSKRGLNSWSTIYDENITGEQLTAKFVSIKVSELDSEYSFIIERGTQYDVKFTRSTSADDERRTTKSYLKSIREVIDVAFTRPGRILMGVTALATGSLNTSLDVKGVRQGRIVNVYDGMSWSLKYSNNRAWVVLDIVTQPVISGTGESGDPYVIERYEGIPIANIDTAFFYEWAVWCATLVPDGKGGTEERSVCNFNVDTKQNLFSLAYKLAQVGRAKLFWEGTKLSGWLDAEVADADSDLVTWDNIISRSWENVWIGQSEMAGTINVFYRDEDIGYERTSYPYSDEDSGVYTRSIEIEGSGETRWSGTVRIAKFALDRNRLIRNINKFKMHKDAIRHHLGDVICLQAKTPNWGENYRVVSVESNVYTATFDRVVDVAVGDLFYIRAFDSSSGVNDVQVKSYTVASKVGCSVTFEEPLDPIPQKDDVAAASKTDSAVKTRRIIKIAQSVDNYYEITVETYTSALFTDEDSFDPDNPNPDYIWPAPSKRSGLEDVPVTWRNISDLINKQLPPQPNIDIPWISNCEWTSDSGGTTVSWDARTVGEPITFRYRGVTYEITADLSTKEYIYWDPDFTDRFLSTDDLNTAIASGNWVVAILKDNEVHVCSTPMQLLHAGLVLAGTIRAESYAELRQTMAWTGEDSLDANHPYTFDFKLPSETTALISAKLSFKIKDYRAYATGAANDAGMTTSIVAGGSGTTGSGNSLNTSTDSGTQTGGASGSTASGGTPYTQYADGTGSHQHAITTHMHGLNNHIHSVNGHTHNITATHTHSVTVPTHSHTTPMHNHDLNYNIFEESNSVNVDFHIDDGSGFGAQIGSYSGDQLDIDISSYLTVGAAWKAIRFDTDARCRIVALLEVKVDVTA